MINPKRVSYQDLAQLLDIERDPKAREDYTWIEEMTRTHLFSKFPERRIWALDKVKEFFGGRSVEAVVETEVRKGVVWAYLGFVEPDAYFLVGRYREDTILLEPEPSEVELSQWPVLEKRTFHLMWYYDGWGVYPDNAFPHSEKRPDFTYRTYEVPLDKEKEAFRKLLLVKEQLETDGVEPSPEVAEKYFPRLEELL